MILTLTRRALMGTALAFGLAGVAAAVVGIIAATCVQLGWATLQRVPSAPAAIAIFVLALTTVWFWKSRYAPAVVLLGAALAGWAVFR